MKNEKPTNATPEGLEGVVGSVFGDAGKIGLQIDNGQMPKIMHALYAALLLGIASTAYDKGQHPAANIYAAIGSHYASKSGILGLKSTADSSWKGYTSGDSYKSEKKYS